MLYVSNIIDDNTIEVSDSRTLKTTVVDTNKLRTEGTKVFGLTQSRVVAYRDVEDFLTRYALRQKLVNRDYEYTFEYTDNEVRVSGIDIYTANMVDLEIPDFIDTLGDYAFQNKSNIRSVYIPDSVVRLGDWCFYNCDRLESVRLSQSLPYLVERLFYGCVSLKSVVLPESITELGGSCFYGCTSLESIILPKSLTILCDNCFDMCESLKRLCLPSTVTYIGSHCFNGCFSLEDINISNTSITELNCGCFSMCRSLKRLELPDSLQKIDQNVFSDCDSLEEICIPSLLNTLKQATFYCCSNLRKLTIMRLSIPSEAYPKAIDLAFTGCYELSTVRVEVVADNSISDLETFIRLFKKGVPSIKILEMNKSVGVSLNTISRELGIEIRLLEE